jgi:hypothetical protein
MLITLVRLLRFLKWTGISYPLTKRKSVYLAFQGTITSKNYTIAVKVDFSQI